MVVRHYYHPQLYVCMYEIPDTAHNVNQLLDDLASSSHDFISVVDTDLILTAREKSSSAHWNQPFQISGIFHPHRPIAVNLSKSDHVNPNVS